MQQQINIACDSSAFGYYKTCQVLLYINNKTLILDWKLSTVRTFCGTLLGKSWKFYRPDLHGFASFTVNSAKTEL